MAEEIFYTDNPSEYPLLEGLYVTEKPPAGFIEGADLNTVGYGGVAVRGPTEPQVIASSDDFTSIYGERDFGDNGPLISELWAARVGKQLGVTVCRRVVAADATVASLNFETLLDGTGVEIITVAAASAGVWAGIDRLKAQIKAASDGVATHFNLEILYLGKLTIYENLNTNTAADDNLAEVVGDEVTNLVVLTKLADGRPVDSATITEAAWVAARDADGYIGLADVGAAYTGVDGTEGTLVSGDYIAAQSALAAYEGVDAVLIAGASVDQNALNGQIAIDAAAVSDRAFLTWSGTHAQSRATEITNADTDFPTRSDRVVWSFNSHWVRDPKTNLLMQRGSHEYMASLYSQTEVDTHVGAKGAVLQLGAGINKVDNTTLQRGDLKLLKAAGICTLEKIKGGFLFRSGVTMSLETGKKEIAQRRMRDFLQISAAEELVDYVKAKGTGTNRILLGTQLIDFSQNLKDDERIVEAFEVIQIGINSKEDRKKGIEKVLWRVQTLNHWLSLVVETEIGVGVTISEA